MPFDWEEYVNLSDNLNSGTPSNSQMRAAVSRAYYGVFCLCRNYKGLSSDRSHNIHNTVINLYKDSDNVCELSIGNLLDGLRKNRNLVDYDGLHTLTQQSTNLDISNARSIINNLSRIRNGECD